MTSVSDKSCQRDVAQLVYVIPIVIAVTSPRYIFQLSVITTIPSLDQPIETIVSSITVTMCRYNSSGI
ncbi:hypothetical protein J6590_031486, partial [Homalodisca vitripennis]